MDEDDLFDFERRKEPIISLNGYSIRNKNLIGDETVKKLEKFLKDMVHSRKVITLFKNDFIREGYVLTEVPTGNEEGLGTAFWVLNKSSFDQDGNLSRNMENFIRLFQRVQNRKGVNDFHFEAHLSHLVGDVEEDDPFNDNLSGITAKISKEDFKDLYMLTDDEFRILENGYREILGTVTFSR